MSIQISRNSSIKTFFKENFRLLSAFFSKSNTSVNTDLAAFLYEAGNISEIDELMSFIHATFSKVVAMEKMTFVIKNKYGVYDYEDVVIKYDHWTDFSLDDARFTFNSFSNLSPPIPPICVHTPNRPELEDVYKMMAAKNIMIIAPLQDDSGLLGLLLFSKSTDGRSYSVDDVMHISRLATVTSLLLQKNYLYSRYNKLTSELYSRTVDLKNAHDELQSSYAQLKTLDIMKDDLIAITSHELRTPLTIVKNNLWLILNKEKDSLNENSLNKIASASKANERAIKLINAILTVSQLEGNTIKFNFQPTNLVDLVKTTVKDMTTMAQEKSIQLVVTDPQDVIDEVSVDRIRMQEVITNLVSNALKYTPNGGSITLSFAKKDTMIELSVKDSGEGISSEDQHRLFKKFGRLQDSYVAAAEKSGTGLGLYITKQIIEAHKGYIWVESTLGEGTTFTFSLPLGVISIGSDQGNVDLHNHANQ